MAQFVRIGVLVVDLEQCAFETVDGPAICVYTQGRTFGPYPEKSDMYRVLEAWMSQQVDLADVVEHEDAKRLFAEPDFVENAENEPLSVAHVRICPDDKNDLFALGIATAGPEHDLTVFFPDGTVRRDEGAYVFPGGSVASVEAGEVLLAVRTW